MGPRGQHRPLIVSDTNDRHKRERVPAWCSGVGTSSLAACTRRGSFRGVTHAPRRMAVPRQSFAAILERIGRLAMQPAVSFRMRRVPIGGIQKGLGDGGGESTAFG